MLLELMSDSIHDDLCAPLLAKKHTHKREETKRLPNGSIKESKERMQLLKGALRKGIRIPEHHKIKRVPEKEQVYS